MKKIGFIILFVLLNGLNFAQNFTDSNLPVVLITTDINPSTGQHYSIENDQKTFGSMKIIFRPDGSRNFLSDQNIPAFLNYNGRIAIKIRGQSTQALPKKQFRLDTYKTDNVTNNNVSLLGMPEENDWILNGLGFDPLLIRDRISYDISRQMGNYATDGRYCEVMINGVYQGIYMLSENIKRDTDRLNIAELLPGENSQPAVSGGYITKSDKLSDGDYVAWSYDTHIGGWVDFIHDTPEPDEISTQQHNYIKSVFDALKNTTAAQNASVTNGFPSVIDIASFVDFMLVNEFASNVDAYQYSTFFHKDRGGKLRAGPVWDFNLTFGNDLFLWGFNRSHSWVWQFDNWDNVGARFWINLYNNPGFRCYFAKRWSELSAAGQLMNYASMNNRIDSLVSLLAEARPREQQRWQTIGNETTYMNNVLALKAWINARTEWLDANIGSLTHCNFPETPNLVISKIHYNPKATAPYTSNDLEFIEITNHSASSADISGYFFSEPGMSFVFPSNTVLAPGQKIYLSFNSNAFKQFYGLNAFGQYTRNMSNKKQKLVLRDPWGNITDYVPYADSAPWPAQADGDGPYLMLTDLDLDNSLASSWTISGDALVFNGETDLSNDIRVFPNPFIHELFIQNQNAAITKIEVFNALGQKVFEVFPQGSDIIRLGPDFPGKGIYFLKVFKNNSAFTTKKLIKTGM